MYLQSIGRPVSIPILVTGVALALAAPAAGAASVIGTLTLQSSTQLVTSGTTTVYSEDYVLPTAGTVRVTLTDNLVGSALTQLEFSLLNGGLTTTALLKPAVSAIGSSHVWTFDVAAGHYTTLFQATAGALTGAAGFYIGQFSDTVVFTPAAGVPTVPLPPAGGVLLAGVGVLGAISRRGGRASAVTTTTSAGLGSVRRRGARDMLLGACVISLSKFI